MRNGQHRLTSVSKTIVVRTQALLVVAWIANIALLVWFVQYTLDYLESTDGIFNEDGRPTGGDFVVFWSTAVLTAEDQLLELFDPAVLQASMADLFSHEAPNYAWAHPPPMLFFILPFGELSYLWALAAWSLLTLSAYFFATRKAALLFAPSTMFNLQIGQAGFLLGAMYYGALRVLDRKPVVAGVCIGLIAVKPHLGILIPVALLAARAWVTILSATMTIGALVLLSGAVFGWEAWRLWIVEAMPQQAEVLNRFVGKTITLSAFSGARSLGLTVWVAWLVQAPFTVLGLVATWWAFSRLRRRTTSAAAAYSVLLLSTAIATPYMFNYDLTLISPVALFAMSSWLHRARNLADMGELFVWLLIWTLPFTVLLLNDAGLPIGSLIIAAALGLTIWRALREEANAGIPHPATATGRNGDSRGAFVTASTSRKIG